MGRVDINCVNIYNYARYQPFSPIFPDSFIDNANTSKVIYLDLYEDNMCRILNIDGYSGVKQFICVLNTVDNFQMGVGHVGSLRHL